MESEYSENCNFNKNNIINISTEITLGKTNFFDHSKKIDIVKKINKIKKKEYLIDIFNLITLESKDYSENNNGIFIFFHNLSDELYEKIDSYVNNLYKLYKHVNTSAIFNSELSDTINNYSDTIEISNIDKNLSNKEKMIMRRKKYEEYLNHNQIY